MVFGEPGAGKTILAVRLVLDLPARRTPGRAVPLASWDPDREHLWDWLRPGCAWTTPRWGKASCARGLWDAGLLLPVLDGLDEIGEEAQKAARSPG